MTSLKPRSIPQLLQCAGCVAPRSYGSSLIGLTGVGASPSSGAQGSVAFTQEPIAHGNSSREASKNAQQPDIKITANASKRRVSERLEEDDPILLQEASDLNLILFYRDLLLGGQFDQIPRRALWRLRDLGLVATYPTRRGVRLTEYARRLLPKLTGAEVP
jgi:hypothetical protein